MDIDFKKIETKAIANEGQDDEWQGLCCPECGFDYNSIVKLTTYTKICRKGEYISADSIPTTVIEVDGDGISVRGLNENETDPIWRGTVIDIQFSCENHHLWKMQLRFHKGQTICMAKFLKELDIGNEISLWRD